MLASFFVISPTRKYTSYIKNWFYGLLFSFSNIGRHLRRTSGVSDTDIFLCWYWNHLAHKYFLLCSADFVLHWKRKKEIWIYKAKKKKRRWPTAITLFLLVYLYHLCSNKWYYTFLAFPTERIGIDYTFHKRLSWSGKITVTIASSCQTLCFQGETNFYKKNLSFVFHF